MWVRKPQFSGPECLKCTRIELRLLTESEEKRLDAIARSSVVIDLTVLLIHEAVPTLAVKLRSDVANSQRFKNSLKRIRITRASVTV